MPDCNIVDYAAAIQAAIDACARSGGGRGEPIYISAFPWSQGQAVGRVRFKNVLCCSENRISIHGWQPADGWPQPFCKFRCCLARPDQSFYNILPRK